MTSVWISQNEDFLRLVPLCFTSSVSFLIAFSESLYCSISGHFESSEDLCFESFKWWSLGLFYWFVFGEEFYFDFSLNLTSSV